MGRLLISALLLLGLVAATAGADVKLTASNSRRAICLISWSNSPPTGAGFQR